jgi:hypothetical protein
MEEDLQKMLVEINALLDKAKAFAKENGLTFSIGDLEYNPRSDRLKPGSEDIYIESDDWDSSDC